MSIYNDFPTREFIHKCSKCGLVNHYKYLDYDGKFLFPRSLHCYNCNTTDKCTEGDKLNGSDQTGIRS